MPLSYGRPLWRSPRLRCEMSQARPIVRKTNETPAKAKPTTYQTPVIVLQPARCPRCGVRGVGARSNEAVAGPGSMPDPSRSSAESTSRARRRSSGRGLPIGSRASSGPARATGWDFDPSASGRVGTGPRPPRRVRARRRGIGPWGRRGRWKEAGAGGYEAGCGRLGITPPARPAYRQWGSDWRLHTEIQVYWSDACPGRTSSRRTDPAPHPRSLRSSPAESRPAIREVAYRAPRYSRARPSAAPRARVADQRTGPCGAGREAGRCRIARESSRRA